MLLALIGNQNCGKTTLFDLLAGSNQRSESYIGVATTQKTGDLHSHKGCSVVNLPGIYSLRPYSQEEIAVRDFLIKQRPNCIINVIDATNIERNLYLTLQLLELRIPMVIALNMMDELLANGGSVDVRELSCRLGVPVVPISATKGDGVTELIEKTLDTAQKKLLPAVMDFCEEDTPVHRCIHAISHLIYDHAHRLRLSARFCTSKLIEGGSNMETELDLDANECELLEHCLVQMESESGLDRNAALADMRYDFIERLVAVTVTKRKFNREHERSVKIDKILTGKYTAIPVFFGIMLLIFFLTFGLIGKELSNLLSMGVDFLTEMVNSFLVKYEINPVVRSLVVDGVFHGVGSILGFLPLIVTLFFFLSVLEDSGYMARVAFVMDRPLRKLGLSGQSFIPMIIGFGCTVPAIMATRSISSERDRRMTIFLIPYMSCSAKIPLYTVVAAAFFHNNSVLAMAVLYFTGMITGIAVAFIMKHTIFKGRPVPFILELPNYRVPSIRSVGLILWAQAKDFLERAFTVIFMACVLVWFMQSFDARLNIVTDSANSILATLGQLIAPIFAPIGFGDWRVVTALISGFTAKEAVVSTLAVLLGTNITNLSSALGTVFSPLSAVSFLVFALLYTPCVAAIATARRELGSRLKTLGLILMQCTVGWIVAFAVYNVGRFMINM